MLEKQNWNLHLPQKGIYSLTVYSLTTPVFKPQSIKLVVVKTLNDRNYNIYSSWLILRSDLIEIEEKRQNNSRFV